MARITWWYCLWFMRRPWIKAMQRWALRIGSPARRERAYKAFVRQNDFARKNGLTILTIIYNLFFAYVLIALMYWLAVTLIYGGYIKLPDSGGLIGPLVAGNQVDLG